jgi:Lipase
LWQPQTDLTTQGCAVNGKFAFTIHGWGDSKNIWQFELTKQLLKYRGGCVIQVTWAPFSDIVLYPVIVAEHFKKVSLVITNRMKSLEAAGVTGDQMYLYGHSLGARLSVDCAIAFGIGRVAQIDGK